MKPTSSFLDLSYGLTTTIFLLLIGFECVLSCHTFNNTVMTVVPKVGKTTLYTVSGCVWRQSFREDFAALEIEVKNQYVPHIGKDAVKHLAKLSIFTMSNCSTKTIAPGAFRNVPRIWAIALLRSQIKTIPSGVFVNMIELNTLRLGHNEISTIEDAALDYVPSLKKFDVNDNLLETIKPRWFQEVSELIELDLQKNKFRQIPRNSFRNLINLTRLYLGNNNIEDIQDGAFNGLKKLQMLSLRYNRLKTLSPAVFPRNIQINWLIIDANRLNYLSDDIIKKTSLHDITFQGNPWKCSCWRRIELLTYRHNVTVLNSPHCRSTSVPICVDPLEQSDTCVQTVDEEVTMTFAELVRQSIKAEALNFEDSQCVRLDH